ncbi:MAG: A/G-specific adenine glycosylase [Myxococcota bacterium]
MPNLRARLLSWYDREGRDLPWRHARDPYAIWVSEVMLQQTRVDTVIPYYERFLAKFPTARALAEADEDEVLAQWSGLGYYRRARLLHQGVREVVAHYGGAVPEDPTERRGLPGVGRYTAGAIGSIAFNREEPVVDGNVSRVLCRLFGIDTPLGSAATTRRLWEEAERLVVGRRPGDFNQALMELGATICTPRSPRCSDCPAAEECESMGSEDATRLPIKARKKPPKHVALVMVVATSGRGVDRRVWLVKGDGALFGGLWGLPSAEHDPRDALRRAGLEARLKPGAPERIKHVLTHRQLDVAVHRATGVRATPSASAKPFDPRALGELGISTLTRKALEKGDLALSEALLG